MCQCATALGQRASQENPPALAGVFCGCSCCCCCCVVSLSPTRGFLLTPPLSTMLYSIVDCIPSPMLYCLICIFLRRLLYYILHCIPSPMFACLLLFTLWPCHLESRRNTPAAVKYCPPSIDWPASRPAKVSDSAHLQ